MDVIGEESRIPLLNVEEGDVYVLLGFPIAGLFLGSVTGFEALVLPLVLVGLVFGIATVYAAPEHLTASTWVKDVYRYYATRPRVTFSAPAEGTRLGDAEASKPNEGGLVDYTPFSPDERTQDLTNVERAWPGASAIERSDGAMVAMLELDPANMDFAMSGDWAQLQSIGEDFANNELNFSLSIHATTRPFPVERLVSKIDDRLEDDDVKRNPTFRALLEEYRETRPEEMAGTQQQQYYLGVEVNPFEVYQRHRTERSPAERLTRIPLIGMLFNPFVTRRDRLTQAEVRSQMVEKLDTRCRTLETELVGKASGWSARRLSTVELFVLTMDFWNGEDHEYGDPRDAIRTTPAVDHEAREDNDE